MMKIPIHRQPNARPNSRNLKWVSKLDKPIGKCGLTGQPGINAAVNYINDLLELGILSELILLT
jgi:hypothetical protein